MVLYALREIENAGRVALDFLTPIELRRWLKLALIVLFVGGGGNSLSSSFNAGNASPPTGEVPLPSIDRVGLVIVAVVVAAVVLLLLFALISAVMEFVFVESLRSGEVTIRRYWRRRWRQGLRLFGFRFVLFLPLLLLGLGFLALFVLPMVAGIGAAPLLGAFLLLPVVAVVALLVGLVDGFTTVFVVPIMILTDCRVLDGWRRLWPTIRAAWKQYLAYVVLQFVLTIGLGLATSIVLTIVALAALIPLGVLGYVAVSVFTLSSTAGLASVGVLVAIFVLVMVVASAVVQVPVQTYLRYYALLILGDVEPELDLIPERRAAVQGASGEE
ncbi:MAG: hypothetical protein ABEJ74_05200 [Haloferacaceae archaeon]